MNARMKRMIARIPGAVLVVGLSLAPTAAAQEGGAASGSSAPCAAAEHHQFDFWVGAWNVYNVRGQRIGKSRVRVVSDGCAVLEAWQALQGRNGTSINFFDPESGLWHQVWVGGAGMVLRLQGSLQDGSMVLSGTAPRKTPQGTVLDRLTWTPHSDGTVEQRWLLSSDGGATWTVAFRGIYRPRAE